MLVRPKRRKQMVNLTVLCYVGIIIERRWMQSMLLHEVVMVR